MPTVPGSCGPNGGQPGTSVTKGAARNSSFGTLILVSTRTPLFPTSFALIGPRCGSAIDMCGLDRRPCPEAALASSRVTNEPAFRSVS
jgi:hypothetical protein